MNRIIAKVERLGRSEMVALTSEEPKKALINFISEKYSLPKTQVEKNIKKINNRYYYNEYYITR